MKKFIISFLLIFIICSNLIGCSPATEENTQIEEQVSNEEKVDENIINPPNEETNEEAIEIAKGKLAPNFTLENLNGEEVSLDDYRGKIVLLNFWATWCYFCDIEMPDLQKLDNENDDLVVLAINVGEDKNTVEEYITEAGYEFEVLLDEKEKNAQTYLISSFPTSYFIDENGILLGRIVGALTYEQMVQVLDSIRENN